MAVEKGQFGSFLKAQRLKASFGLRRFADLIEMPASNLSAVEHGRRSMPADKVMLSAEVIGLVKGTENWDDFFDLATVAEQIPADVQKIVNKGFVPALLRTIDNAKLTDDDIKNLIEEIEGKDGRTQTEPS
ncbi:MAG: helix-turn-helix domain-containing protein [Planctomycetes bacterium]|nr:helix-turn-helix domain-containing protein [Planctomycetota bacterium]